MHIIFRVVVYFYSCLFHLLICRVSRRSANRYSLQANVHTVNLHQVQDKYYLQTRRLLLKLLEGESLQQVTLYNVWLSDDNLRNLISICAGLPTREPPDIEVQVLYLHVF